MQFPLAVYLLEPISVYLPYLIFFLKIFLFKCTTAVLNLLFCCKSVNYIKPADGSMKQSKLCISQTTFVTIEARLNFGTMEYFLANGPSPLMILFCKANFQLVSSVPVDQQILIFPEKTPYSLVNLMDEERMIKSSNVMADRGCFLALWSTVCKSIFVFELQFYEKRLSRRRTKQRTQKNKMEKRVENSGN